MALKAPVVALDTHVPVASILGAASGHLIFAQFVALEVRLAHHIAPAWKILQFYSTQFVRARSSGNTFVYPPPEDLATIKGEFQRAVELIRLCDDL